MQYWIDCVTGLQRRPPAGLERPPASGSPLEDAIVAKFVSAWDEGRDLVARFCASIFSARRRFDLVRTRANGQPAVGAYLRAPNGIRHGVGLYVLTLTGDRICAMTRFENSVLPWFGLPRSLPSQ